MISIAEEMSFLACESQKLADQIHKAASDNHATAAADSAAEHFGNGFHCAEAVASDFIGGVKGNSFFIRIPLQRKC